MAFQKMCAHCQKPFVARYREAKFCSNQCANTVIAVNKTVQSDEDVKVYLLDRSWRPNGNDGCWEWTGSFNDNGYGMAFVRQSSIRASRLAYEIFVGPIPANLHILHDPVKCNNRACINPQHLRCGTNADNMQDRAISGTVQHGEGHYRTHLIEEDIREIRRLYNQEHMKLDDIALLKNIDFVTVHGIIKAKTWKHVDADTYIPPADGRQVLTEDDAKEIISLRKQGLTCKAIATKLNDRITLATVYNVCSGRSKIWRHLL